MHDLIDFDTFVQVTIYLEFRNIISRHQNSLDQWINGLDFIYKLIAINFGHTDIYEDHTILFVTLFQFI